MPNGTVTVTNPTGSDFKYSNNGGVYQEGTSFTVAAGASYSITVKNINSGCISTATTGTMDEQPIMPDSPTLDVDKPTCTNANGTVTVTSPTGSDYKYSNNGGVYQDGTSFTLAAGASYSITVKKLSSGCISTANTGTMDPQPATPNAPSLKITEPSLCDASTTGSIEICNPVPGYTYNLVGGSSIVASDEPVIFNNLAAGSNPSVTVTNTDGCTSAAADCSSGAGECSTSTPPLRQSAKTTDTANTKTTAKIVPVETAITSKTETLGFDAYPVSFQRPTYDQIQF